MQNAETVNRNFNSEGKPKVGNVKIINTDGSSMGDVSVKNSIAASETPIKGINGLKIGFNSMKTTVNEKSKPYLDKIVDYLKEHETTTITITGYIDKSEAGVAKLAGKRVATIYKYLISKGIKKERLDRSVGGADSPIDQKKPTKNMRVEITILEE